MLGKCANPDCNAEFKRLGSGKIFTQGVSDPEAWGLPHNIRQKVVWLCSNCAMTKDVRFDQEHCQVVIVNRTARAQRRSA